MLNQNFVLLAAVFNIIGSTSYVIETIKGNTKPNRVTWFLWALAPMIAFAAMIGQGVGISALMTFMVGFGPLVVFISSFINKKAYWRITTFDIVCGLLSLVALALWGITRIGIIAIIFSLAADALASVPTVIKAWKQPDTEDYRVFMFAAISSVITMLTLKSWDFASFAFPVYIFIQCANLALAIRFPHFRPFTKRVASSQS